jgi:hypothetical protein
MPRKSNVEANGDRVTAPVPIDDPSPPMPAPSDQAPESRDDRQLPAHTVRMANIRGSVWANYDDRGRVRYAVTFCRLYRAMNPDTGEETWAVSYSYNLRDLALLEKAAAACFLWIQSQLSPDTPF